MPAFAEQSNGVKTKSVCGQALQSWWLGKLVPGLLLVCALLMNAAALAASAGKVLMATGETERLAASGTRSAIQAGDTVFSGDTLFTGSESRLQWRTNDGGLFALRPNSEFRVDDYQYDAGKRSGRSFFSLAKGGFRTLTGSIGKKDHDNYRVTTPVATLGIRGTHYVVQLCLTGFAAADGCSGVSSGLYLGTITGAVLLGNAADSLVVRASQAAFVGALSRPPELLRVAPGMLKDTVLPGRRAAPGPAPRIATPRAGSAAVPTPVLPPARLPILADEAGDVANLSAGSVPAVPEVVPDPIQVTESKPDPVAEVTVVSAPEVVVPPEVSTPPQPPEAEPPTAPLVPVPPVVNPGFHSTAVASGPVGLTPLHTNSGSQLVLNISDVEKKPSLGFSPLYDVATPASVVDSGEDPVTGVYWGRIIDGLFNVAGLDAAGKPTPTDAFGERSLHFVSGTRSFDASLPITGTADYRLVGATSPTDAQGHVGSLDSASLHADFSNQTVAVDLGVSINASSWTVSSAAVPLTVAAVSFAGKVPVAVGVAGSSAPPAAGIGEVSGFFAGTPASAGDAPPAAGLSYSLTTGNADVVSGAAAFDLQ